MNGLCDDGAYCNGMETCTPGVGCANGPAPTCVDSNECTLDNCDEANDTCTHVENPAACDDGNACTDDACTPSGCTHLDTCGACCMLSGNCLDGVNFNECLNLPGDNSFLGFGSVCQGDADHDGADDACGVRDEIPTVSQWGLVVLSLLLLIGAKVRFAVWRQAA